MESSHPKNGSSPLTRGKLPILSLELPGPGLIPAHAGKTDIEELVDECFAAHPRSRGENSSAFLPDFLPGGSSPLTRGKPPAQCSQRNQERLIPAHAGKTKPANVLGRKVSAHPRSRGENYFEAS